MSNSEEANLGLWQKIDIVGKVVGATLIPISIALASYIYAQVQHNREIEAKKFELSIQILEAPPSSKARDWATAQFRRSTGVDLDPFAVNLTGDWSGVAHDNAGLPRFRYLWNIVQTNEEIEGTIQISTLDKTSSASYDMKGLVSGDKLYFEGEKFIEPLPDPASTWCMASGSLSLRTSGGTAQLVGEWAPLRNKEGGCPSNSGGQITLRKRKDVGDERS